MMTDPTRGRGTATRGEVGCGKRRPGGLSEYQYSCRIPAGVCDDLSAMRHNAAITRFRSPWGRLIHRRRGLVAAACVGALTLPAAGIVSAGASGGAEVGVRPSVPVAEFTCTGPPPFAGQVPEGETPVGRAVNRWVEALAFAMWRAVNCPLEADDIAAAVVLAVPPEGVPTGPPDSVPVGPPEGVPAGPPDSVPVGPPEGVPAGPPVSVPVGPPEGVPAGPPVSVPVGPPEGVPAGPPVSVPVGPPEGVPAGPPVSVPVGAPEG